ncbi:hypothetical protein AAC387_Pa06g1668 [Persea americana]
MALQKGLLHLESILPAALQIESDCLALVTSIKNSSHPSWDMVPQWHRTMHLLTSVANWTVHYCKHSANHIDDMLSRYEIPADTVTRTEPPPHICCVVDEERERAGAYTRSFLYHPPEPELSTTAGDTLLPSYSNSRIALGATSSTANLHLSQ